MWLFIAKVLRKLKIIQRGYLSFLNFSWRISVLDKTIKIPVIHNMGWTNIFSSEPWMTTLLSRLMTKQHCAFIDVGINIGQTLIKVKSIDPEVEYTGFEVNPTCVFYVHQLIRKNKFRHCTIYPVGLSDKTGIQELQFYSGLEDDATASIIDRLRPSETVTKKEMVAVFKLDEVVLNIPSDKTVFLKIDVEGAEREVLSGAKQTLDKLRPVIFIEILPAYSLENKQRINNQNSIVELMNELKYTIYQVNKKQNKQFDSIASIQSFPIETDVQSRDFLLIPEEKTGLISHLLPDN